MRAASLFLRGAAYESILLTFAGLMLGVRDSTMQTYPHKALIMHRNYPDALDVTTRWSARRFLNQFQCEKL